MVTILYEKIVLKSHFKSLMSSDKLNDQWKHCFVLFWCWNWQM